MRTKINEALESVLKQFDEKYFIDGIVNKSKVIQDLDTYDEELLTAFLSNEVLKDNFTIDIAGNTVLQTNKLIDLLEADEYWQDSYTKYSKKIGLTAGGKFIDENEDVVLDFPYKDTILKASMSKEDTDKDDLRPDEPFLNEVIAKEEIDVLLDKKIFVNAKKYDKSGSHQVEKFSEEDNLIIKGNNLLALHAIKEKFTGKVKLIYIDPPFNTGNDSFKYNDNFNRSSWLTFMKNRLEVAKELLKEDGILFIHVDNNEVFHLKVLCDEIFENNFINMISVKSSTPSGVKTSHADKTILKSQDFILAYSKTNDFKLKPQYQKKSKWDTHYRFYIDTEANELLNLSDVLREKNIIEKNESINDFDINNPKHKDFYVEFGNYIVRKSTHSNQEIKKICNSNQFKDKLYKSDNGYYYLNNDMLQPISNSIHEVLEGIKITNDLSNVLCDFWDDIDFQNTQNQGGVSFPRGKKPEQLLYRLIKMTTEENDLVLDFFMGSASTQAVAHKMNRRYIGIEQMDYIHDVSIARLNNVIEGEQGGMSKGLNWQGGGSFVYVELMEKNKGFIDAIRKCDTQNDVDQLFNFMLEEAEIDFRVDLEKVKDTLHKLSLDDQKKTLFKIIEKNQLYYNYSEIDDENVRDLISDSDYKFNKSFYEGGE